MDISITVNLNTLQRFSYLHILLKITAFIVFDRHHARSSTQNQKQNELFFSSHSSVFCRTGNPRVADASS